MAQPGRALRSGRRSRAFKSRRPDSGGAGGSPPKKLVGGSAFGGKSSRPDHLLLVWDSIKVVGTAHAELVVLPRPFDMGKRLEANFKGQVQGVGFRFTVENLAKRFQITGFVENLRDGKVQLVAEGEESELSAFLLAVKSSSLKNYIRDFEISWQEPKGEFSEFFIRYGGY